MMIIVLLDPPLSPLRTISSRFSHHYITSLCKLVTVWHKLTNRRPCCITTAAGALRKYYSIVLPFLSHAYILIPPFSYTCRLQLKHLNAHSHTPSNQQLCYSHQHRLYLTAVTLLQLLISIFHQEPGTVTSYNIMLLLTFGSLEISCTKHTAISYIPVIIEFRRRSSSLISRRTCIQQHQKIFHQDVWASCNSYLAAACTRLSHNASHFVMVVRFLAKWIIHTE